MQALMLHLKKVIAMERIELFDNYIAGILSEAETAEFKSRLDSDSDFAAEFRVYLLTVRGICQEAEQENIEFGHAMKSLNKSQLMSIIGKSERPRIIRPVRERILWMSSIAAVLVIAIGVNWYSSVSSSNHLCDVVYNCYYESVSGPRSAGGSYVNLDNLTARQIEDCIPELAKRFDSDTVNTQDWHIDGESLAMAYLKLHRKDDAVRVLKDMAAKADDPRKYNRMIQALR